MSVFDRILSREADQTVRLGNPLRAKYWYGGTGPETPLSLARMNAMSLMTGGRGFRTPPKGPKLSKGGTTRREREAHLKEIYASNLKAEADFRASVAGGPGWGLARIRDAIERGEHLRHASTQPGSHKGRGQ